MTNKRSYITEPIEFEVDGSMVMVTSNEDLEKIAKELEELINKFKI